MRYHNCMIRHFGLRRRTKVCCTYTVLRYTVCIRQPLGFRPEPWHATQRPGRTSRDSVGLWRGDRTRKLRWWKEAFAHVQARICISKCVNAISSLSCLHIARAPFLSTACRRLVLVRISCGVMYVVPFEIHGEIVSPNTVTLFVIFVAGFLQESARVGQCSCLETLRL